MSVLTFACTAVDLEAATPCRTHESDLWFSDRPTDIAIAQDLCRGCALRTACLAGALERQEPWGVWGGELFERGVVVARKRPRGRPRKDDSQAEAAAMAALRQRLAGTDLPDHAGSPDAGTTHPSDGAAA